MDKKTTTGAPGAPASASDPSQAVADARRFAKCPYMQNRELSWLTFDERCLDQGADPNVPLLEQLQFISIFWSNLQEFFMVRVGSLTDLSLLKKEIIDTKSNMTPTQQLDAIYARCHELYPTEEQIYRNVHDALAAEGVRRLTFEELSDDQRSYAVDYLKANIMPFLTPQVINSRHPFPHLENGAIYIVVRLTDEPEKKKSEMTPEERKAAKEARKKAKNQGAEGVMLGIVPMPPHSQRVIKLPGEGFNFILLEDLIEANVAAIYSMYHVKHANVVCVTRNADLDATETADEGEEDYRDHMKKILKKRARLAPVRLESKRKLSSTVSEFLLSRLHLEPYQTFVTSVPLNLSYAFALPGMVDPVTRAKLTSDPFSPAWPAEFKRNTPIMEQIQQHDVLLSYPYESMDPFVKLLQEAAVDPDVVSIKITLYRLASQSHLAEALISAAENGKEVTALFELRARFDESNNIQWSQRFEQAGANVIYGFHDYKVHSKICCITRSTEHGLQHITQLGTGNYNEKTAKLYTDFSFITTDEEIGRDATEFFRNMSLENASRAYQTLWVAPLQIKQNIIKGIDEQIALSREGKPCGLFFKTNSVTDREIIVKIAEASRAGVPVTMLVRGISCLLPQIKGETENVHVVSIVGRQLEHSRIYAFGTRDEAKIYLSSADLMTRNMDKRVEIAWPVREQDIRAKVLHYIDVCMHDNVKLRELRPDGTYTPLGANRGPNDEPFNAQEHLIAEAREKSEAAREKELSEKSAYEKISMQAQDKRRADAHERTAMHDLEDIYREALQHEIGGIDEEKMAEFVKAAARVFIEAEAAVKAEEAEKAADGEPAEPAPEQAAPEQAAPAAAPASAANDEAAAQSEAPAQAAAAPADAAETVQPAQVEPAPAESTADAAARAPKHAAPAQAPAPAESAPAATAQSQAEATAPAPAAAPVAEPAAQQPSAPEEAPAPAPGAEASNAAEAVAPDQPEAAAAAQPQQPETAAPVAAPATAQTPAPAQSPASPTVPADETEAEASVFAAPAEPAAAAAPAPEPAPTAPVYASAKADAAAANVEARKNAASAQAVQQPPAKTIDIPKEQPKHGFLWKLFHRE